jgi:hypothetical protein
MKGEVRYESVPCVYVEKVSRRVSSLFRDEIDRVGAGEDVPYESLLCAVIGKLSAREDEVFAWCRENRSVRTKGRRGGV